jgi:hypothetical protein
MSVSKSLRKILFGLIFAMAVAACAVDDSDSPGASPPAATADDGTPTTTPDEGTPSPSLRTSPSPSPTAPRETPSDEDLLKVGDRGPAVKEVQTLLKALGYELTVDGVFGPNTMKPWSLSKWRRAFRVTAPSVPRNAEHWKLQLMIGTKRVEKKRKVAGKQPSSRCCNQAMRGGKSDWSSGSSPSSGTGLGRGTAFTEP